MKTSIKPLSAKLLSAIFALGLFCVGMSVSTGQAYGQATATTTATTTTTATAQTVPHQCTMANCKQVMLGVKGMTCSHCKAKVEAALEKVSGVQKATADVAKNNVTITTNKNVPASKLIAAVKSAGFDAIPQTTAYQAPITPVARTTE